VTDFIIVAMRAAAVLGRPAVASARRGRWNSRAVWSRFPDLIGKLAHSCINSRSFLPRYFCVRHVTAGPPAAWSGRQRRHVWSKPTFTSVLLFWPTYRHRVHNV